ncbi:sensor histidine kinase, partial [Aquifex sp.]
IFFLVALSLLTLLGTVWLSMYLARFISEPIERLTEKALQISKGNLDVKIEEEKRGDEIEKLYRAFSQMRENLKKLYENLRREQENLRKLLDTLPVAVLFLGKDGRDFRNKTFARMFGKVESLERFFEEVKRNKNIRVEKLETEEGTIYIFEDVTPIVLAERFKVWEEAVKRIAHEIKNPLTPIKLNLERILRNLHKEKLDREKLSELIRVILKEVDRINLLITQFRNLSFDRKLEPKKIRLSHLLEEVKRVYLNTGIKIEIEGDREVVGDEGILKEVFFNLINNSIENGATKVLIKLEGSKLIYRDNGKGLSPEEARHIFEPFFSTNPKGFGIGMSVVKKIVEEHGWEVKVMPSAEGFYLEIDFKSKN